MIKFIIRKTWIVKAETAVEALNKTKGLLCDSAKVKILSDEKGGKQNGKKIKIEKVKEKGKFRKW